MSGDGSIDGRSDDLVVFRAVDVGLDDEAVVPVLDIIFDAGHARRDQLGRRRWRLGIDDPDFGRVVVVDVDEDVLLRIGLADAGEHAGVLFLVDQHVVGLRRAEHMPEGLQRPVVVVLQRVEIALAVGRPGGAAGGVLQHVGCILAGRRVAHPQFVEFRAIAIEGPGGQAVIGRHGDAAEAEIFAALAQFIAVEQQLLRP